MISSGLFLKRSSGASDPHRETSSAAYSNTHGRGLRPNPAVRPPPAAHFGNRGTRRRTALRPSTLNTDAPLPSSPVLDPPALGWRRRPGRQRGRGRARDSRRTGLPVPRWGPAGASETGRVVRKENGRAARTSHGFHSPAVVARLWQWRDFFSFRHCC